MATSLAPPPPVTDDDDDDDMADLFSFGTGEAVDVSTTQNGNSPNTLTMTTQYTPPPESPDSFLEELSAETSQILPGDGRGAANDPQALEILQWLDAEDAAADAAMEEIVFTAAAAPPEPQPTVVAALPPSYATFAEAMASTDATREQIRALFVKEQGREEASSSILDATTRVALYCRMICNKSVEQTENCSLADSFLAWRTAQQQTSNALSNNKYASLGERIAESANKSAEECTKELNEMIGFHQQQQRQQAEGEAGDTDVLLPPIAATILSTGVSIAAGAVLLSNIIPNSMPLLALPPATERWEAALSLHSEFYLLASYHVPLLVVHLDRHLPGWYWPQLPASVTAQLATTSVVSKARNLTQHGLVPPSWLVSGLTGDINSTLLPLKTVLQLWDSLLTSPHKASMRFFLLLALLEQASPRLLLLQSKSELEAAMEELWTTFPDAPTWRTGATGVWWKHATLLQEATPRSALARLERAEDVAVQNAAVARQKRAEEELQARLEAEAAAHREAQERKAEEARQRLSRARLVAFYRKHAPSKESNVEKIMETYDGRLEVLDAKLRGKYGEGFNPALKPKPLQPKPDLMAALNNMRKKSDDAVENENDDVDAKPRNVMSLMVTPDEVLPVVCWSKEQARAHRRSTNEIRSPLKYYLVDGRPEQAVSEQGRFPTAVTLSPEALMDPERIQQTETMFESLRGACHIVIMGEGFDALPRLYNQKISPKLAELMEQDRSRINMCALFFQTRGFCFVSVLDGGFCAAHSWLAREGPAKHLSPSIVLVDYSPEACLFGQLESLRTASTTEKAQRKMANLLESSLVTMTKKASQIERLAMGIEESRRQGGLRINNLFGRSDSLDGAATTSVQPNATVTKREEASNESNGTTNGSFLPDQATSGTTRSPSEVGIALGKWGGGLGAAAKAKWGQFRRKGKDGGDGKTESAPAQRFEKV